VVDRLLKRVITDIGDNISSRIVVVIDIDFEFDITVNRRDCLYVHLLQLRVKKLLDV